MYTYYGLQEWLTRFMFWLDSLTLSLLDTSSEESTFARHFFFFSQTLQHAGGMKQRRR